MDKKHSPRTSLTYNLAPIISGLFAGVCFLNSLHGEFVHDDLLAIVRNKDVRAERPVSELFYNDFWGQALSDNTSHKSYRPITTLTFRFNFLVSGLDPFSYHVINVLCHVLSTFLFTLLSRTVFVDNNYSSLLSGLLFACHPVHTEAVSSVVGRADVLSCLFFLISVLAYTKCGRVSGVGWPWLGVSLVSATCAMLSKEQGVTAMGIMLLFDIVQHRKRRKTKHAATRCLIVITWGACLLAFRLWIMSGELPLFTEDDNPAAFSPSVKTRWLTFLHIYARNLVLLTYPVTLSYDWSMNSVPLIPHCLHLYNLCTLLVLALPALILAVSLRTKSTKFARRLQLALGLLVLPYIPASNIFFIVGFVIAERVLYIPSMGFILLLVLSFERIYRASGGAKRKWLCVAFMVLCGSWSGRTLERNGVWRSREALFRSGVENLPHNAKIQYNYGNLLKDTGNVEEAKRHYKLATELWPRYASAYNNLGTLLNSSTEAETMYKKALDIVPCHANAHFNLGHLLLRSQERIDEGIKSLQSAIHCDPTSALPHLTLTRLYKERGELSLAVQHYTSAVQRATGQVDIHASLAEFTCASGLKDECLSHVKTCLQDDPAHIPCLQIARLHLTDYREQVDTFITRAVSSRPLATVYLEVGLYYLRVNQHTTAREYLLKAYHQQSPDNVLNINLARALHEAGESVAAYGVLQGVILGLPTDYQAVTLMADIAGVLGRHSEAVEVLSSWLSLADSDNVTKAYVHLQLGKHHRDMTNMEDSFKHFALSVELNGEVAESRHNLAIFLHRQGDLSSARHHYTKALDLDPANKLVKSNLNKLDTTIQTQRHTNTPIQWTSKEGKPRERSQTLTSVEVITLSSSSEASIKQSSLTQTNEQSQQSIHSASTSASNTSLAEQSHYALLSESGNVLSTMHRLYEARSGSDHSCSGDVNSVNMTTCFARHVVDIRDMT